MDGKTIEQARNSLKEIIYKLRSVDPFNTTLFDDNVELYIEVFVQATEQMSKTKAVPKPMLRKTCLLTEG